MENGFQFLQPLVGHLPHFNFYNLRNSFISNCFEQPYSTAGDTCSFISTVGQNIQVSVTTPAMCLISK